MEEAGLEVYCKRVERKMQELRRDSLNRTWRGVRKVNVDFVSFLSHQVCASSAVHLVSSSLPRMNRGTKALSRRKNLIQYHLRSRHHEYFRSRLPPLWFEDSMLVGLVRERPKVRGRRD